MRAYNDAAEESLLARHLLKGWDEEGLITGEQYREMEQETASALRRTNIYLRVVLFLFTVVIAGAGAALCFQVFRPGSDSRTIGAFLLCFAAVSYGMAEFAVSRARLYRYGIEEALAVCSAVFLCAGVHFSSFGSNGFPIVSRTEFLAPAAGAAASVWIWCRFGLPYAVPGAMIFALWIPDYWHIADWAQHVSIAALYTAGLVAVIATRSPDRSGYLNRRSSFAEAFLWLGIYLAVNIQLSSTTLLGQWWSGQPVTSEFPPAFRWATWALTWCLPALVLRRGLRQRERAVIAVGGIAAVLTLITNKPYLGWPPHTWDPMMLGALLTGAALLLRRWLSHAPSGIRHGFTARRLSGKDAQWIKAGSAAFGFLSPHAVGLAQPAANSEVRFGGGDSGGGGASSNF